MFIRLHWRKWQNTQPISALATEVRKRAANVVFTENVTARGSMVFEKWTCKMLRFNKNVCLAP